MYDAPRDASLRRHIDSSPSPDAVSCEQSRLQSLARTSRAISRSRTDTSTDTTTTQSASDTATSTTTSVHTTKTVTASSSSSLSLSTVTSTASSSSRNDDKDEVEANEVAVTTRDAATTTTTINSRPRYIMMSSNNTNTSSHTARGSDDDDNDDSDQSQTSGDASNNDTDDSHGGGDARPRLCIAYSYNDDDNNDSSKYNNSSSSTWSVAVHTPQPGMSDALADSSRPRTRHIVAVTTATANAIAQQSPRAVTASAKATLTAATTAAAAAHTHADTDARGSAHAAAATMHSHLRHHHHHHHSSHRHHRHQHIGQGRWAHNVDAHDAASDGAASCGLRACYMAAMARTRAMLQQQERDASVHLRCVEAMATCPPAAAAAGRVHGTAEEAAAAAMATAVSTAPHAALCAYTHYCTLVYPTDPDKDITSACEPTRTTTTTSPPRTYEEDCDVRDNATTTSPKDATRLRASDDANNSERDALPAAATAAAEEGKQHSHHTDTNVWTRRNSDEVDATTPVRSHVIVRDSSSSSSPAVPLPVREGRDDDEDKDDDGVGNGNSSTARHTCAITSPSPRPVDMCDAAEGVATTTLPTSTQETAHNTNRADCQCSRNGVAIHDVCADTYAAPLDSAAAIAAATTSTTLPVSLACGQCNANDNVSTDTCNTTSLPSLSLLSSSSSSEGQHTGTEQTTRSTTTTTATTLPVVCACAMTTLDNNSSSTGGDGGGGGAVLALCLGDSSGHIRYLELSDTAGSVGAEVTCDDATAHALRGGAVDDEGDTRYTADDSERARDEARNTRTHAVARTPSSPMRDVHTTPTPRPLLRQCLTSAAASSNAAHGRDAYAVRVLRRHTHPAFVQALDPLTSSVEAPGVKCVCYVGAQCTPTTVAYLAASEHTIKLFRLKRHAVDVCDIFASLRSRPRRGGGGGAAVGVAKVRKRAQEAAGQASWPLTSRPALPVVATHVYGPTSNHVQSLDVAADGQTFLSTDDLQVLWWDMEASSSTTRRGGVCIGDVSPPSGLAADAEELITAACFHRTHSSLYLVARSSGLLHVGDLREPPSRAARRYAVTARVTPEMNVVQHASYNEILCSISTATFCGPDHVVSRDYLGLKLWDLRQPRAPCCHAAVMSYAAPYLDALYADDSIFDRFAVAADKAGSTVVTGLYGAAVAVWQPLVATMCDDGSRATQAQTARVHEPADDDEEGEKCALRPCTHCATTQYRQEGEDSECECDGDADVSSATRLQQTQRHTPRLCKRQQQSKQDQTRQRQRQRAQALTYYRAQFEHATRGSATTTTNAAVAEVYSRQPAVYDGRALHCTQVDESELYNDMCQRQAAVQCALQRSTGVEQTGANELVEAAEQPLASAPVMAADGSEYSKDKVTSVVINDNGTHIAYTIHNTKHICIMQRRALLP